MTSSYAYIAYDGQLSQCVEDGEPDTDVLSAFGHGSSRFADELLCVESNFDPVVEEGEEGRERKRRHEDGYETKLED